MRRNRTVNACPSFAYAAPPFHRSHSFSLQWLRWECRHMPGCSLFDTSCEPLVHMCAYTFPIALCLCLALLKQQNAQFWQSILLLLRWAILALCVMRFYEILVSASLTDCFMKRDLYLMPFLKSVLFASTPSSCSFSLAHMQACSVWWLSLFESLRSRKYSVDIARPACDSHRLDLV